MTAVTACLYCQKQLKTKVLIKNGIILKAVLIIPKKQNSAFKAKYIYLE